MAGFIHTSGEAGNVTKHDYDCAQIWSESVHDDTFESVAYDAEGNVYAGGQADTSGGGQGVSVRKWDADGNLLWSAVVGGSTIRGLLLHSNGLLYAAGTGGAYLVNGTPYFNIQIAALDPADGSVSILPWEEEEVTQLSIGTSIIWGIIETADNQIAVCGTSASNVHVAKITAALDEVLWTYDHGGRVDGLAQDSSGNIYICGAEAGGHNAVKLTSAGAFVWGKYFFPPDPNDQGRGVAVGSDDNPVFVGGLSGSDYNVIKTDPDGDEIWTFVHGDIANAVTVGDNDDVIIVGDIGSTGGTYLRRLDSDGNEIETASGTQGSGGGFMEAVAFQPVEQQDPNFYPHPVYFSDEQTITDVGSVESEITGLDSGTYRVSAVYESTGDELGTVLSEEFETSSPTTRSISSETEILTRRAVISQAAMEHLSGVDSPGAAGLEQVSATFVPGASTTESAVSRLVARASRLEILESTSRLTASAIESAVSVFHGGITQMEAGGAAVSAQQAVRVAIEGLITAARTSGSDQENISTLGQSIPVALEHLASAHQSLDTAWEAGGTPPVLAASARRSSVEALDSLVRAGAGILESLSSQFSSVTAGSEAHSSAGQVFHVELEAGVSAQQAVTAGLELLHSALRAGQVSIEASGDMAAVMAARSAVECLTHIEALDASATEHIVARSHQARAGLETLARIRRDLASEIEAGGAPTLATHVMEMLMEAQHTVVLLLEDRHKLH